MIFRERTGVPSGSASKQLASFLQHSRCATVMVLPPRAYLENNQSLVILRIFASGIVANAFKNLLNKDTGARFCMASYGLGKTFTSVLAAGRITALDDPIGYEGKNVSWAYRDRGVFILSVRKQAKRESFQSQRFGFSTPYENRAPRLHC